MEIQDKRGLEQLVQPLGIWLEEGRASLLHRMCQRFFLPPFKHLTEEANFLEGLATNRGRQLCTELQIPQCFEERK
jgi:hypothetical protein